MISGCTSRRTPGAGTSRAYSPARTARSWLADLGGRRGEDRTAGHRPTRRAAGGRRMRAASPRTTCPSTEASAAARSTSPPRRAAAWRSSCGAQPPRLTCDRELQDRHRGAPGTRPRQRGRAQPARRVLLDHGFGSRRTPAGRPGYALRGAGRRAESCRSPGRRTGAPRMKVGVAMVDVLTGLHAAVRCSPPCIGVRATRSRCRCSTAAWRPDQRGLERARGRRRAAPRQRAPQHRSLPVVPHRGRLDRHRRRPTTASTQSCCAALGAPELGHRRALHRQLQRVENARPSSR